MQELSQVTTRQENDMLNLSIHFKCYRCGKQGHSTVKCKHKKAKCCLCQKVGHLARVCQTAGRKRMLGPNYLDLPGNEVVYKRCKLMMQVTAVQKITSIVFSTREESNKCMITVSINRIMIEMEVDSGAERLTVPKLLFNEKLKEVCSLSPSTVNLHQYYHSPLTIVGECHANIQFNGHKMKAIFVVVDITGKHPLFGRDWFQQPGIDLTA